MILLSFSVTELRNAPTRCAILSPKRPSWRRKDPRRTRCVHVKSFSVPSATIPYVSDRLLADSIFSSSDNGAWSKRCSFWPVLKNSNGLLSSQYRPWFCNYICGRSFGVKRNLCAAFRPIQFFDLNIKSSMIGRNWLLFYVVAAIIHVVMEQTVHFGNTFKTRKIWKHHDLHWNFPRKNQPKNNSLCNSTNQSCITTNATISSKHMARTVTLTRWVTAGSVTVVVLLDLGYGK